MKIFTSLFLCILFNHLISSAQCTRTAALQDGNYVVEGNVTLTFLTNGDKTLDFSSDFSTMSGPDLHVFLSNSSTINTSGGVLQTPNTIEIGSLTSITGAQSYDLSGISPSLELDTYNYVIIQCYNFNQLWGNATLGVQTGSDCETLTIDTPNLKQHSRNHSIILKNRELIIESLENSKLTLTIFSITGKKILNSVILTDKNNTIDLSFFPSGIYITQLYFDNQKISKKIIIP